MEAREFAYRIVTTCSLREKLSPAPDTLSDTMPQPALRLESPGRPDNLQPVSSHAGKVPSIAGFQDPCQRRRILHSFANHELQAAELFAWALLAFPDAPAGFRSGLLRILADEQRHTRMYIGRLKALGVEFGDYPVTGYFWNKAGSFEEPVHFVCAMSLTFENANLDHTINYAEAAREAGDWKTAGIIDQVHVDEIEHVRFGWQWLQRFKAAASGAWESYCKNVHWPLRPALAKATRFHRRGREAAGLDEDFIDCLAETPIDRPLRALRENRA